MVKELSIVPREDKDGLYTVHSSSNPDKTYTVDMNKLFCSCPAYMFRMRAQGKECKHIEAVRKIAGNVKKENDEKILNNADEVIKFIQDNYSDDGIDTLELVEKYGDEMIDELIRSGQLLEMQGKVIVPR